MYLYQSLEMTTCYLSVDFFIIFFLNKKTHRLLSSHMPLVNTCAPVTVLMLTNFNGSKIYLKIY